MFTSIEYLDYQPVEKCNRYTLYDTCMVDIITSPYNSPSLANQNSRLANTLTLFSIVKSYETRNRNVALNIAHYYGWLFNNQYQITPSFIEQQFRAIDLLPNLNFMKKYYHNVIQYIYDKSLLKRKPDLYSSQYNYDKYIAYRN